MGGLIIIAISLALFALAIIVPVVAKILIHLDYAFLLALVYAFVFGANGFVPNALLANVEIHTVFVILIYLAALAIWYGLQQINIFTIYIFRIVACAFSAFLFVLFVSTGLFGQTIAEGMDIIWQWTVGIVYFAVTMILRAKSNNLLTKETPVE